MNKEQAQTLVRRTLHAATLTTSGFMLIGKSEAAVVASGNDLTVDSNSVMTLRDGGMGQGVILFEGYNGGINLYQSSGNLFATVFSSSNNFYDVFSLDGDSDAVFFPSSDLPNVELQGSLSSGSWVNFGESSSLVVGDKVVFGWRVTNSFEDSEINGDEFFYGWTELEIGSIMHRQTFYNDEGGQPIFIGQVPEPSSIALLALGATGLAAQRRRKKLGE